MAKNTLSGLDWEGRLLDGFLYQGVVLVPNDRALMLREKQQELAALMGAKEAINRDKLAQKSVEVLLQVEPNVVAIEAIGGNSFHDLRMRLRDSSTKGISAKNNSRELYGGRVSVKVNEAIARGIITDPGFETMRQNVNDLLTQNKGAVWNTHPAVLTQVKDMIAAETLNFLKRQGAGGLEKIGRSLLSAKQDAYLVSRHGSHVAIQGFNLNKSLSCQHIPGPKGPMCAERHGDYVHLPFKNGWAFHWRVHNRGSVIVPGSMGYSACLIGTPHIMFQQMLSL